MKGGFLRYDDDEAFWREPLSRQRPALLELVERRSSTLALDAPTAVDVAARGTLPAVVGLAATYQELHGTNLGLDAALVAVNPDTSEVFAAGVLPGENLERRSPGGPPPPVKGKGGLVLLTEARGRLGLPWAAGNRYLLSVALRHLASNRVPVALSAGPGAFVDPAAAELVLERRRAFALRPTGEALDPADAAAKALVPPAPGLAVALDRVVVADPGAPATLRLGLRTSLRPWERVTRQPWVSDDPTITGVVPVTLVVCGAQDVAPVVLPLRVAVRDELPEGLAPDADGPEVALSFALDLRAVEGFPRRPGTWFVSAFSGAHAAGPAPVALISPLSLKA